MTDNIDRDLLKSALTAMERIDTRLGTISDTLNDVRTRLSVLEANHEQIKPLAEKIDNINGRLIRVETRGATLAAGIAFVMSALVAIVTAWLRNLSS